MCMKNLYLLAVLAFFSTAGNAQNTRPVRFSWGVEIFPENFDQFRRNPQVPGETLVNGKFARYIQFEKTLTSREREEIAALRVDLVGYVYPATYLVLLPAGLEFEQLEKFSPRSVLALKPEWKMAASLREPPYGAWAVHGDWIDVNLQVFPNVSLDQGAARCRD